MNLIEAIKDLRKKGAVQEEITKTLVSWGLEDAFVGRVLNSQTLYELSQFVDHKLVEFTNQGRILHGPLTPVVNHPIPDEQVCSSRDWAGVTRAPWSMNQNQIEGQGFPLPTRKKDLEEVLHFTQDHDAITDVSEDCSNIHLSRKEPDFTEDRIEGEYGSVRVDDKGQFIEGSQERLGTKIIRKQPQFSHEIGNIQHNSEIINEALNTFIDHTGVNIQDREANRNRVQIAYEASVKYGGAGGIYPPNAQISHLTEDGIQITRDCPYDEEDLAPEDRGSTLPTAGRMRTTYQRTPGAFLRSNSIPDTGKVACVTSYDIDYHTLTVKANIIIAPPQNISSDIWFNLCEKPKSTSETIQNIIKSNLIILTDYRARPVITKSSDPEQNALLTLRELITEEEFRRYLKNGFILVKASNDRTYQIFRDRSHSVLWQNGKMIEEICVRLKDKVPATDNVIAFKTMIETSEDLFRNSGNIYKR